MIYDASSDSNHSINKQLKKRIYEINYTNNPLFGIFSE